MPGAIASEHHLASALGARLLQAGGNAVDACIATALAVGTLNPYHSCIGGGGFAVVRTNDTVETLDFRVTAPAASTAEFYLTADTSHGGAAVGVPGEIRGFAALHKKHGKLPWRALFGEVIALAEGMPMGKDLYDYLSLECPHAPEIRGSWLASDPEFAATFSRNGVLIPIGEQWSRRGYAATLRAIAADPEAFYGGDIAEEMVRVVREKGGLMTMEDVAGYQPIWREPLVGKYGDYEVYAPPAPASGGILLSALGTLDVLEKNGDGSVNGTANGTANGTDGASARTDSDRATHNLIEALRLAYGQRVLLGDPAYVPGLEGVQAAWLAPGAAKERAAKIRETTREPAFYLATPAAPPEDSGTSHITAADGDGGVCSITTTIGQLFAARIMLPCGVMLNDSMDDFSVAGKSNHFGYAPSVANYVCGGKRPQSSQCPYIAVRDGKPAFAGGSAGGATIISANVQVVRHLARGSSALGALAAARLHDMVLPDVTVLERGSERGARVEGWSEAQAEGMKKRGHNVQWIEKSMSTPSCIRFFPHLDAAGDPRKYDGAGAGGVVV